MPPWAVLQKVFAEQAPTVIVSVALSVALTLVITQGFNAVLRTWRDRRSIVAKWGQHDWLVLGTSPYQPHFLRHAPCGLQLSILVYFHNQADTAHILQSAEIRLESAGASVPWSGSMSGAFQGHAGYERVSIPLPIEAHGMRAVYFHWGYDVVQGRHDTFSSEDFMRDMQALPTDYRATLRYHVRAVGRSETRVATQAIPFRSMLLDWYEGCMRESPETRGELDRFLEVFRGPQATHGSRDGG